MMTSPTALAKLGWFLMEARQHQTNRHKDVIMVSPPNQGKASTHTVGALTVCSLLKCVTFELLAVMNLSSLKAEHVIG